MHMADALISPEVGLSFAGLSGAILVYSAKKLKDEKDEKKIPLMGVLSAFVFASQMINFSIPGTGSSGHLVGGVLLVMLLGPYSAFIALSSVLFVQALFFADGGILALGCNIWNMAFYPCFVGFPIYRMIVGKSPSLRRSTFCALILPVITLELGAISVVVETVLSGISELPFSKFFALMAGIHFPIGVVEGIITALVFNLVYQIKPDILHYTVGMKTKEQIGSFYYVLLTILIMTLLAGGVFAWFASEHPDGLEWSIERTYGSAELPEPGKGIIKLLADFQEKVSFLPDYEFKAPKKLENEEGGSIISASTTVSGIVGSFIVLGFCFIIGLVLLKLRGRRPEK